jgi:hypothetical protein
MWKESDKGKGGSCLPLDQGGEIVHALASALEFRRHV